MNSFQPPTGGRSYSDTQNKQENISVFLYLFLAIVVTHSSSEKDTDWPMLFNVPLIHFCVYGENLYILTRLSIEYTKLWVLWSKL